MTYERMMLQCKTEYLAVSLFVGILLLWSDFVWFCLLLFAWYQKFEIQV